MSGAHAQAELIAQPNWLKKKLSGSETGPPGTVAGDDLARARSVVQEYHRLYPAEAERAFSRLLDLLGDLRRASEDHAAIIQRIRKEAMAVMGDAEALDFPRLGWLARSIYDLCDSLNPEQQGRLMRLRIGWMERALRAGARGYEPAC